MVAVDANVFSLMIFPASAVPTDFRTGKPIADAHDRVDRLIAECEEANEPVLVVAPVLAEALVVVAHDIARYVAEIENAPNIRVRAFGTRAATELALRTRAAIDAGDKREGMKDRPWQKLKFDRQIMACVAAEGARAIYSCDEDVHRIGNLWGIKVLHLSDVPLAGTQASLFEAENAPESPASGG